MRLSACAPSFVSSRGRALCRTSGTPSAFSSPVIAREMFAVFTSIAVAAAVSVPERAKATK